MDVAAEDTTAVRVRRPGPDRLTALVKSRQTTMVEVVHSALDVLERQDFLRDLHEDHRSPDPAGRQALLGEEVEQDPLV